MTPGFSRILHILKNKSGKKLSYKKDSLLQPFYYSVSHFLCVPNQPSTANVDLSQIHGFSESWNDKDLKSVKKLTLK